MKKKSRFKKHETGYHASAVKILAGWVNGKIEQKFYHDGQFIFVPDIVCYKNGIIDCIYEVVYSHPLSAKKYGLIQYWCYMNVKELTVFEVSADYILKQTSKPDYIRSMECYLVSPFEYEEIDEYLIKSIS
jgi:hypothetical protein